MLSSSIESFLPSAHAKTPLAAWLHAGDTREIVASAFAEVELIAIIIRAKCQLSTQDFRIMEQEIEDERSRRIGWPRRYALHDRMRQNGRNRLGGSWTIEAFSSVLPQAKE